MCNVGTVKVADTGICYKMSTLACNDHVNVCHSCHQTICWIGSEYNYHLLNNDAFPSLTR